LFSDLLNQRVETVRREAEEEAKIKDDAIKQEIDAQDKAAQEQTRHSSAMNKIENPKSTDDDAAKQAELDKEYAATPAHGNSSTGHRKPLESGTSVHTHSGTPTAYGWML
jgi:hypothetical protein